jgi:uncharacterized protein
MKNGLYGLIVLILIFIAGYSIFYSKNTSKVESIISKNEEIESKDLKEREEAILKLNNKEISLIISDTKEEEEKGLGGLQSLPNNNAMLFVFDRPDLWGIWMKDMLFSIDVIWLDENYNIVHIEENLTPDSFPQTYFTPTKSLYVIEANNGFVKENNLKIGDSLQIDRK